MIKRPNKNTFVVELFNKTKLESFIIYFKDIDYVEYNDNTMYYKENEQFYNILNNKNIKAELIRHHFYTNNYVYQLEKLGFMQFLKNKGAVCDKITEGPKYTSETESYVAKCTDGNIYLLKFDYDENTWLLVK